MTTVDEADPAVLALLRPRARRARWWLVPAGLGAACLAALLAAQQQGVSDAGYQTSPVVRGALVRTVSAVGALTATRQVEVGSDRSGRVVEVEVDVNDPVRAGQVLARLDPAPFENDLAQAEAQLAVAQGALEQARAHAEKAEAAEGRAAQLHAQGATAAADHPIAALERRAADAAVTSARAKSSSANADRSATRSVWVACSVTSSARSPPRART